MVKPDETDPITHGCSHQGQTVDRQSRAVVSGAHRFRMRRPRGRPRELYDYSRRTRKFSIDPTNLFGVVDFHLGPDFWASSSELFESSVEKRFRVAEYTQLSPTESG